MCRQVLFDVIPRRCGDTTWSSGRSTRLPFALWPQRDRCMMRSVGVGCCNLVIDLFLRRVRRCNAVTRTRRLRPIPQGHLLPWASTETRTHPSSPHGTPSEPSHLILLDAMRADAVILLGSNHLEGGPSVHDSNDPRDRGYRNRGW